MSTMVRDWLTARIYDGTRCSHVREVGKHLTKKHIYEITYMRVLPTLSKGGLARCVEFRYRYILKRIILTKGMQIMPYSKGHQLHHTPAEEKAAEQEDIKKLGKVVEGAFESIAKLTKLSVQEVLHIIEEVDVAQLKQATQEAIKEIAESTDLNSANIVAIFMANRDASIDDIVHRLREESHVHRARW
jgi:hypothetical protein